MDGWITSVGHRAAREGLNPTELGSLTERRGEWRRETVEVRMSGSLLQSSARGTKVNFDGGDDFGREEIRPKGTGRGLAGGEAERKER